MDYQIWFEDNHLGIHLVLFFVAKYIYRMSRSQRLSKYYSKLKEVVDLYCLVRTNGEKYRNMLGVTVDIKEERIRFTTKDENTVISMKFFEAVQHLERLQKEMFFESNLEQF